MTCHVFFGLNLATDPNGNGQGKTCDRYDDRHSGPAGFAAVAGHLLCRRMSGRTARPTPARADLRLSAEAWRGASNPDATLTRIAHDQAAAMAAKDQLDHSVLGRFNARVDPAGAGRAAENIAYGYDNFPKTLDQWINSSGHRRNLLLPNATRVGVASVKSSKTGRMYWAMVIAGDYERPSRRRVRQRDHRRIRSRRKPQSPNRARPRSCRLKILSLCL